MKIVNYYNDDIINQIEQVIDEKLVKKVNKILMRLVIFMVILSGVIILNSILNNSLLVTISIIFPIMFLLLYMILSFSNLTEKRAKIFYCEKLIRKNITKVYKWDDKNFIDETYNKDKQLLSKITIPLNQISSNIIENKVVLFTNNKLLTIIIIDDAIRENLKQA